jgi:nucleoside-diphosphate-sugar epimerase
MKIFITGASGYIGSAVAQALRRAGHEVWGLVRNPAKASDLHRSEIHTIIGSLQQPEKFLDKASQCDVLIHAAADYEQGMASTDPELIKNFLKAAQSGSKTIVYTSGVWVYGNTGKDAVDESAALNPAKHVAWRPGVEQMVLNASGVRSIVIRPGCVYGKQGSLTANWFQGAEKGEIKIIGDGKNHWTMIHVDDLADAYVRIIESDHSGVFNVTDPSHLSVARMVTAALHAAGKEGSLRFVPVEEAAKTMSTFAECLTLDQHVDSSKVQKLLGWKPRHSNFVDGAEAYYLAWKSQ